MNYESILYINLTGQEDDNSEYNHRNHVRLRSPSYKFNTRFIFIYLFKYTCIHVI